MTPLSGARAPGPERMASYAAHELRAPLTSLRMALALLDGRLAERLAPEERELLGLAAKSTERLNGLVNDILDLSKIRAGAFTARSEPCSARAVLQEAADILRAWAVAKGIRLVRKEPAEPLPRARGDFKRSVQVLVNLISNAVKFTPSGGTVELSARLGRHEHRGTLVFRVRDTGPGIPRRDLERVFRCFEQSALGEKRCDGTGLGLTLAKAMVEAQGGRIWAESWQGLGASVLFTLPILEEDLARPAPAYPQAPRFHGLLVDLARRLSAFAAALAA